MVKGPPPTASYRREKMKKAKDGSPESKEDEEEVQNGSSESESDSKGEVQEQKEKGRDQSVKQRPKRKDKGKHLHMELGPIPGGPEDETLLKSFREHIAHAICKGDEDGLVEGSFKVVDQVLISVMVERWHQETNTFHLPFGEMTITLDDVSQILGIPVVGTPMQDEETFNVEDAANTSRGYSDLIQTRGTGKKPTQISQTSKKATQNTQTRKNPSRK